MYKISFSSRAKKDAKYVYKSEYRDALENILKSLQNNPYKSPPLYEKLAGTNKYSCKINDQHRVVYGIDEKNKIIKLYACWTHFHKK